ncbi:hypothetical protein U1Q18_011880 [Sarracenia purpurea var. burkii]
MADMYKATCSSSSSLETDDLSLFLHQILLRSSSSPSSSDSLLPHKATPLLSSSPSRTLPQNPYRPIQSSLFSGLESQLTGRISTPESFSRLNSSDSAVFSSSCGYFPASATNASSSVGNIDDPDEYDCESEGGFEALVEEVTAKPVPPRNPSKRSRAAEVHNLSEKRRRSRINEKMKALQNLIPNSNKTDKASMLDEAIEYLKQLQLQVQVCWFPSRTSVE